MFVGVVDDDGACCCAREEKKDTLHTRYATEAMIAIKITLNNLALFILGNNCEVFFDESG